MKNGWPTKRLSELYQIGSSKRVLKSQWKTEGVPFYRGREVTRLAADGFVDNELFISEKHFVELSKEYGVPKAGDIVITAIGTIGNSHVVRSSDRFYFKDASVLWMKRTSEVSSEFVNLWLKSPSFFEQLDRGNGATVDTLTIKKLQSVELVVPPLPEQQRIVGILDEAFDGITMAKANAEKNVQNARAIFESYLQSVFTQRGPGWMEKPLGEVCEVKDGTHDSPKYVADGIPFVTQKNIREEGLSFEKTKFISQEDHENFYRRSNAAQGDVLISMIGANRGMACIVDDERTFSIKNVGLVKQNQSINQQFLLYFLKSPQAAGYVQAASKGGAQEFVGLTELRRFPVLLPPLKYQDALANRFQSLRAETERLASLYERKLVALEALKKSLLHQAFTGIL
jgi:type I restriction enzyme S subunit